MSAYKDFVFDLPERSLFLLRKLEPSGKTLGFEATLLIMVASTGFIVPMERLDPTHPAGDSERFKATSSALQKVMASPFIGSPFFANDHAPWQHGQVDTFGDGPDSWSGASVLPNQKPVSYVLAIIRNALAHGNLFTRGDPIRDLVLFSEKRDGERCLGYKYLVVPVPEFRRFLISWFTYVRTAGVPYRDALALVAQAA